MSKLFFGTPDTINEDDWFSSRKDLIDAGLHRSIQHGIDGNGNDGSAAIVLSGGYEDDRDFGDEIIYTGHGGNKNGVQIEDQSWNAFGNSGLVVSEVKNLPVRVIRGYNHNSKFSPKSGYQYSGLFSVVKHWEETGKSGFKICRFRLIKESTLSDTKGEEVKIGSLVLLKSTNNEPKWFCIENESPNAQKISKESKMSQKLIGKKVGEEIDFGNGFKILEIKRYMSF